MAAALVAMAAVGACGSGGLGGGGSPPDAPTNVSIKNGDQHVMVSWNSEPGINYWIFCATDPSITLDNWTTLPNPVSRIDATSPQMVTGLTNGLSYSCIVNGRHDKDKGGDASPAVTAMTRPAGAEWVAEAPWSNGNVNGIAFGNKNLVAVGDGGGLWYSTDNVTWTPVSVTTNNLNAVTYGNGRFVAVGDGGTVVTSTDGLSWSADTPHTTANLYAVQAFGSRYVAAGAGGTLIHNGDGTDWDVIDVGTTENLYGLAANTDTGVMIVVGARGTMRSTTDTLTWTTVAAPTSADLRSVAYGNGRFAVVGAGGVQLSSADGATWAQAPALTASTLNNVTYNANIVGGITYSTRFVAVGDDGVALYSDDGLAWGLTNGGTTASLRGVVFGLSRYKAVGTGGVTTASY